MAAPEVRCDERFKAEETRLGEDGASALVPPATRGRLTRTR